GIAGGAKAHYLRAGEALQLALGASHRVAELGRAEAGDPHVVPAVRGDLVAGPGDRPDEVRVAPGDPPQSEERRSCPVALQHLEETENAGCQTGRKSVTLLTSRTLHLRLGTDSQND